MSKQVNELGESNPDSERSRVLVRTVYYAIIMSLGFMLAMVVYLAR